jgi:hypothetical protein
MISWRTSRTLIVVGGLGLAGCGRTPGDPVKTQTSYQTLAKANEAFQAKNYAEAIVGYDEAINASVVQADVFAETCLKRAVCRIETGDLDGAAADLEQAERGGAVGEEYQQAQKMLSQKRSRS